ncbi:MAG: cytochrome c family protein [Thermoanaerobaculales bacterium]|nr:cytochrome c family protein [Thermoanaerobaculales bacterium]
MHRTTLPPLVLIAAVACGTVFAAEQPPRQIAPAIVEMQFPAVFGDMQRPAVEFDHSAHTKALEKQGCETCHRIDENGVLIPSVAAVAEADTRNGLIDAYHDSCIGCHTERADESLAAGPVTCGECHVRRQPGISARSEMAFDYSLHARHAKAYDDKCENCHHVYDEATEKLKYEKGKEEGCGSCHGDVDEERKLSLANASHRACVSCHLERARSELDGGPILCVGCHDSERQNAVKKLEEIPRLMRGQADMMWIHNVDAKSATVAFNHLAHEPVTGTCSTCHHQSLKPCDECHSLVGSPEGAGVTMAQAYHLSSSEHSCVGCHAVEAARVQCAGCHHVMGQGPADRTCVVCHSGPPPGSQALETAPTPVDLRLDPLPNTSDDYPETLVIESLVDTYEASTLPHAKIVGKLDDIVRESTLAGRFHTDTATLCSGCHHHSPVGTRPPPCRACHSGEAVATRDLPGLKVAYHRQCVGCHIAMNIQKQGCTDCHAVREVQP